jgi:cytochrome c oxidase subunit II
MNKKILVVLSVLIVMAGCSSNLNTHDVPDDHDMLDDDHHLLDDDHHASDTDLEAEVISTDASSDTVSGDAADDDVVEFNIKSFRFGFDPSLITVKKGSTVRITASSLDVPHGLAIEGYGVNMRLDVAESETVEFVADKEGEFSMFCSVPCGSGHGSMLGKLVVE